MGWFIPAGGVELTRAVLLLSQAIESEAWSSPPITSEEASIWDALGRERYPEIIGDDLSLACRRGRCEGAALRWRVYGEAAYTMQQALAASRTIAFFLDQDGRTGTIPGHMWATERGEEWLATSLIHLPPEDQLDGSYPTPIYMLRSGIDAAIAFGRSESPEAIDPAQTSQQAKPVIVSTALSRLRGRPPYDWQPAKSLVFALLEQHGLPMKANPDLPSQAALCGRVSDLMSDMLDGEQVGKTTVEDRVRGWIAEWRKAPG